MRSKFSKLDELQNVILESGVSTHIENPELDFKDLMRHKVNNILLVSSRYDFYTLVDDGQLTEALMSEYLDLNLHYAPSITRVYSGEAALDALDEMNFDLVITMLRLGDMKLKSFCTAVKNAHPALPIVLLAYQSRELQLLLEQGEAAMVDRIFIWAGDRKLFLAVIKILEDLQNAKHDCLTNGVRAIILVEDSPQFYSSYLPLIYTELIQQSQMLIEEGKNLADKLMRQRARPKILHATTYETAWNYFRTYKSVLLGIITDMKFKIQGRELPDAGLAFIEQVRAESPDLPILVQSAQTELQGRVEQMRAQFVDKYSRTLLLEVREFMKNNFGFGDFVFRMPDGMEIDRARNIRELCEKLKEIPDESLWLHSSNDHFSNWLMARTKFRLAAELKSIKSSEFKTTAALRAYIVKRIDNLLVQEQRGIILDFARAEFDRHATFLRIGGGSLGGKARGLAFVDNIFKNYMDPDFFPNVKVGIPRTVVLGTDVFAQFMEMNNLLPFVVENQSDEEILQRFLAGSFSERIEEDLRGIIRRYHFPLAVRSSSLLEDTLYQPFAGIYATLMIPNSNRNNEVRYRKLLQAIKYVYASTYFQAAKHYIEATGHRVEEEQMAVVIQQISGYRHDRYFYPHFSGVARSYNYYPFGDAKQTDGIVNIALGLGRTIVEGGTSLQFCPALPAIQPQFNTRKDYYVNNQRKFWSLDLSSDLVRHQPSEDQHMVHLDTREAEVHGTLQYLASTYDAENDTLYEGTFRPGYKLLNFAPILHSEIMPLAKILRLLSRLCETAMNCPVEIESAPTASSRSSASFRYVPWCGRTRLWT
jgi:CheY-like chemotaxis protein